MQKCNGRQSMRSPSDSLHRIALYYTVLHCTANRLGVQEPLYVGEEQKTLTVDKPPCDRH